MPIYGYRCQNGHEFEILQSMTDDPVTACTECDGPVERVFHPVAIHFKGSGFYSTDYGKKGEKKRGVTGDTDSTSTTSDIKSDSKSDSSPKSDASSDSGSKSPEKKSKSVDKKA